MKYPGVTLGRIEAVWNILGGEEGIDSLLSGETVVSRAVRVWTTFRTIKVGTGLKTAKNFEAALGEVSCKVNDQARDIMGKKDFMNSISSEETDVDLVVASIADLGFKQSARYDNICERAIELGLDLCEAEDGPQLRRQYLDQPNGERLVMAMKAITDSVSILSVFGVKRDDDGRLWLGSDYGRPYDVWYRDARFVFRRRK